MAADVAARSTSLCLVGEEDGAGEDQYEEGGELGGDDGLHVGGAGVGVAFPLHGVEEHFFRGVDPVPGGVGAGFELGVGGLGGEELAFEVGVRDGRVEELRAAFGCRELWSIVSLVCRRNGCLEHPPRSSSAANESRFVAVGIEDVYRDFVKGVLKLSLFIVAEA